MRKQTHLVCQHLEMISRKAVEEYRDTLKKFVRGRHGLYALYRKDRLCYVGLASDLKGRLNAHLKDRHAKTWDKFSVYLTIQSDHLRELEALAIRIAAPSENRQKGKFKKSEDLRRHFQRAFKERQKKEFNELFGCSLSSDCEVHAHKKYDGRTPILAGYFLKGKKIRWEYKARTYHAYVKRDGTIRFRKKIFTSPSVAAAAITKRSMNGWFCWKFERAPGDWVLLDTLRK